MAISFTRQICSARQHCLQLRGPSNRSTPLRWTPACRRRARTAALLGSSKGSTNDCRPARCVYLLDRAGRFHHLRRKVRSHHCQLAPTRPDRALAATGRRRARDRGDRAVSPKSVPSRPNGNAGEATSAIMIRSKRSQPRFVFVRSIWATGEYCMRISPVPRPPNKCVC